MSKKRRWLSTFLIIFGLAVAAFPIADRVYVWYWQERLLSAYEEDLALEIEAPQLVESDYLALQAIYENEQAIEVDNVTEALSEAITDPASEDSTLESTEEIIEETTASTTTNNNVAASKDVIGKIKISKIDLVMPVLVGATEKNLNRGAATISGTSDFGEIGNVGIAAHRGRSYGIFFNRLDEIEPGDVIEVTANNKVYKYTVYKTHIVEPTDVSVLYRNDKDKVLTLVTCDPVKNPTHRLIVHALQNP